MSRLGRHATTIGLCVAVVGLGGWLYLTRDRATTGETEERHGSLLRVFRPEQLTELAIDRDDEHFALKKVPGKATADDGSTWEIVTAAGVEDADAAAVDKGLSALEFVYPVRTLAPGEVDRKAFGLETPTYRLTVHMGPAVTTLAVGGPAVKPANGVYVDVDGVVSVVKREALEPFEWRADDLRARRLAPYLSSELARLDLDGAGGRRPLVREANGYRFGDDVQGNARIERGAIDRLLGSIADLSAEEFVPVDAARTAQNGAAIVTLTMTPSDAQKPRGSLKIGGSCPAHASDVVVLRESPGTPIAACVGHGVFDGLTVSADDLVLKRAFSLRDDEVEEVILAEGDRVLELARREKGWHQRRPTDADVEAERVKGLLKTLVGPLEAELRTGPGAIPELDPPRATVTIRGGGTAPKEPLEETVIVGRDLADGRVPLLRKSDGARLLVARDVGRAFLPRPAVLRGRDVITCVTADATRMTVDGADADQTLERPENGTWKLVTPRGFDVDVATAADLAETLCHVGAERWVADEPSTGLDRPTLRASITVQNGGAPTTASFRVGARTTGGFFAQKEGDDGVFVIAPDVPARLASLAIDRALAPALDRLKAVRLERGKAKLALVVDHGDLKPADPGVEIAAPRLEEAKAALRDLTADRVAHLGAATRVEGLDPPTLTIVATKTDGTEVRTTIGAADSFLGASVRYAKKQGTDAIFTVPAARVAPLVELP